MKAPTRVAALAASALLSAVLVGLVALFVQLKTLPPSDLAYGTPFGVLLRDPFVLIIWSQMVLIGATLGFALSWWLLWRVKLSKAVPIVVVVSVVAAAAFAPLFGPLCAFPAFVAGVLAMLWCRERAAGRA